MTIYMDPWWCPRWFPRTAVSLARERRNCCRPLSKTLIKELFYPIYSVQRALIDLLKYKLYFPFTPAHFCQLM